MPLYTRDTLPALLRQAAHEFSQVVLIFGERYLARTAAGRIEAMLVEQGATVHAVDGDQENASQTINRLRSFSLLPGKQVYRVSDTRLFHSRQVTKSIWERALRAHASDKAEQAARALRALLASAGLSPQEADPGAFSAVEWQNSFGFARPSGDLSWIRTCLAGVDTEVPKDGPADPAALLLAALEAGLPKSSMLILLCEEVDKRKKLFTYLKEHHTVVDLGVESGSSARAKKAQNAVLMDLIRSTLAERGKTLASGLAEVLLERVGFHPMALVMELSKVILFVGERKNITREDVDTMIGRTRQEALFELTAALGQRDLATALRLVGRLQENGIHALAVVAALRSYVRGLLLCRALQELPEIPFSSGMTAESFQRQCLPVVKERAPWKKEMSGHPFALYMQFKTASSFSLAELSGWLPLLLAAELRLKGSALESTDILHYLLLAMLQKDVLATI